MVRNPLDVADSKIGHVYYPNNTISDTLKDIQNHHKLLDNLFSTLEKDNLITIKLEDLVIDPLLIQEKLSVFLGSQLNLNQSIISQKNAHINRHNYCIKDEEIKELSFLIEWMNKMGYNL